MVKNGHVFVSKHCTICLFGVSEQNNQIVYKFENDISSAALLVAFMLPTHKIWMALQARNLLSKLSIFLLIPLAAYKFWTRTCQHLKPTVLLIVQTTAPQHENNKITQATRIHLSLRSPPSDIYRWHCSLNYFMLLCLSICHGRLVNLTVSDLVVYDVLMLVQSGWMQQ